MEKEDGGEREERGGRAVEREGDGAAETGDTRQDKKGEERMKSTERTGWWTSKKSRAQGQRARVGHRRNEEEHPRKARRATQS